MSNDESNFNQAKTSEALTGIKTQKPPKKSVGIRAVRSATSHAFRYMKKSAAWKSMRQVNQKDGFDCPGCAWPDPDDERSSIGEYCENGMKAIAEEAQKKTIGGDFFAAHSISELGARSDFQLGKSGRLSEPMYLPKNGTHYEPIPWDDAFKKIGTALQETSPDRAVFYTSGRTSNEAAYLYQLFVRLYGTNNLPDCSNMCHESSGQGLSETVGIGKGSVTLEDLHQAELIIVMGQNPGTNHPRMLSALERCKDNGGRIVSVNPLKEAGLVKFSNPQRPLRMLRGGTTLTDLFLPVAINGDIALLKAIMLLLLKRHDAGEPVFDQEFIANKTTHFDSFIKDLRSTPFEQCVQDSNVPVADIEQAADWIANSSKIIVCWAMGLTQHENGVENIREIVNLLLLKGAIGKPGAGTCPVRGHSNVQGDRTMGIWEAPPESFLTSLEERYSNPMPRKHGYAVVDAIEAMHKGHVDVFIAMGGNFLSAAPDTLHTAEALSRTKLTVHVSTKLNRSHLVTGNEALILPCLGRTERDLQNDVAQFVSVENSMGVVHSSAGTFPPASPHLKSEPKIVAGIAEATLKQSPVDWAELTDDYDHVRDEIEAVIPGFENYNERVREPGGFYLPNGARDGTFNTPSGKAQFSINPLPNIAVPPGQFAMMTIRSHDQFNTTIYGLDDRYRGISNERRVLLIAEEDMRQHELTSGQLVDLVGVADSPTPRIAPKFVVVPYEIPCGCVATYFPEANVLVPIDSYARGSKTPASKRVMIRIRPHETTP